jgi:hypothetical protein
MADPTSPARRRLDASDPAVQWAARTVLGRVAREQGLSRKEAAKVIFRRLGENRAASPSQEVVLGALDRLAPHRLRSTLIVWRGRAYPAVPPAAPKYAAAAPAAAPAVTAWDCALLALQTFYTAADLRRFL